MWKCAHRISRGFPAAVALAALTLQLCLPALHALHDRWARASVEHVHDGGPARVHSYRHAGPRDNERETSHEEHDESTCPTCQLFASLRGGALPGVTLASIRIYAAPIGSSASPAAPLLSRCEIPAAPSRGPPALS